MCLWYPVVKYGLPVHRANIHSPLSLDVLLALLTINGSPISCILMALISLVSSPPCSRASWMAMPCITVPTFPYNQHLFSLLFRQLLPRHPLLYCLLRLQLQSHAHTPQEILSLQRCSLNLVSIQIFSPQLRLS